MSLYELTLVFREDAKDTEAQAKALVSGKIKTTKAWGLKDLAYPIRKEKRGNYLHLEIELEPGQVAALDKTLKHNEAILRYLLIRAKE